MKLFLTIFLAFFCGTSFASSESAEELVARLLESDYGWHESTSEVVMTIRNGSGKTKTRDLKILSKEIEGNGDFSEIIVKGPKNLSGLKLLIRTYVEDADEQWVYLPKSGRVKRISTSSKSKSFLSSDFSYEDFYSLELGRYEYEYHRNAEIKNGTVKVYFRPKYEGSAYSRFLVSVNYDLLRIEYIEFFNKKDKLFKEARYDKFEKIDGHWRSKKVTMTDLNKNRSTTMEVKEIHLGHGVLPANVKFKKSDLSK